MTIVSNSEIETYQKCERMFYYSRVLRLRPKALPVFIRRGSFGHDLMEHGFQALLDGGTVDDALQAAAVPLTQLMESDDKDKADLMGVYRHVTTFITWTQSEEVGWKVVALEDRGMWNISQNREMKDGDPETDLIFGYTPDIIIEFTHGQLRGQHAVLDYKFVGQYMTEETINMAQQIPKYIIYRNKTKTDFKIRRGAFVQLNTRATATDKGHKLFLVKWVTPSAKRLERIERENELLAQRVASAYGGLSEQFLRTVNKDVCGRCFYYELCTNELDGKPIEKIMDREFKHNDYGY